MTTYECYTRGSTLIEAETAEQARRIFSELVWSEPTETMIAAIEIEEADDE